MEHIWIKNDNLRTNLRTNGMKPAWLLALTNTS